MELYRRHLTTCPHAGEGRRYTGCRCPVWADGIVDGKRLHRSLRTTSWSEGQRRISALVALTPAERTLLTAPRLAHFVAEHQLLLDKATAALDFGQVAGAKPFVVGK